MGLCGAASAQERPELVAEVVARGDLFAYDCENVDEHPYAQACGLTQLRLGEFKAALADLEQVKPWRADEGGFGHVVHLKLDEDDALIVWYWLTDGPGEGDVHMNYRRRHDLTP